MSYDVQPINVKPIAEVDVMQAQEKEMMLSHLAPELKHSIALEYRRICKLHPGWKKHRAMRKAGEKYSIKFEFTNERS